MASEWVAASAPAAAAPASRRSESDVRAGARARVLVPAGVTALVFAGLILWQLLIPRPYFTGTNSVGVASVVAAVSPGQQLCIPELELPPGTGDVRLALYSPAPSITARITVSAGSKRFVTDASAPTSGTRATLLGAAPAASLGAGAHAVPVAVCVSPLSGPADLGGTAALQYGQQPSIISSLPVAGRAHGKRAPPAQTPVASRIAVWFVPPAGHERPLIDSLGTIFSRAALFRPGIVGPWTYPVLLFLVIPATWLLSILLLLRGAEGRSLEVRGRRIRTALAIGLIAFLNAGSWALITPAFQAPDEPDHFAYVQYLAETGHEPTKSASALPAFSNEQTLALNAVHTYSTVSNSEARPPWTQLDVQRWKELRASMQPHPKNNGGGYTPAGSSHAPPYYALGALAYLLVKSQSVFSQLTAVRLVSALLGAIVAMCAFGVVRELLPRRRVAAVAAGLLVAYHPMFSFISGAVNDDSGINAAAAVSLYLLIRAMRRGLTWRTALGLGAALAIAPLMKETGYEIYPAAAIGLLGLAWREWRRRRAPADRNGAPLPALWPAVAALAATFVGVLALWELLKPHVLTSLPGVPDGAAGGVAATSSVSLALHHLGRYAVYLWQLFLPPLSFMGRLFPPGWPFYQVYIERGWASFGWYTFDFSQWVYVVIVVAMAAVGLLALAAAWRYRRWVARHGWEVALIILFPLCTLLAVEAAFFTPTGGRTVVAEQGRYIFPAIGALAVIAVGGTFGLGKRLQVPLATVLVVAMIGTCFAAQLLTLGSFYT
jgi:4-amino-4-deoxy-L-arabinose transferase-like glycosyltransferase